jgi:hypothetical protein
VPAEGFAERLSREKLRAVLLLQHLMGRGDLTPPSLAGVRDLHRFPV